MYKPISCIQTGAQNGYRRFPPPDHPVMKDWRCDLTALSHVYNLYFVAVNEQIYVYEPGFPDQKLGAPVTILDVPKTGRGSPAGIDGANPHSVTRILVDFLGTEEVLLCTCDDGDVAGWWMGDIFRSIVAERDSSESEEDIGEAEPVKCFELQNVGLSAWGLAVHRDARLIAISSNSHSVKVLAYALSTSESTAASDKHEPLFPRDQNRYMTLRARANIPAVSFDNTGADPTGRWLSSSSIDGLTHLWDLSNPFQPARIIAVGHCAGFSDKLNARIRTCNCPNRMSIPHAAWATLFIDPRSCHRVDSLTDACGTRVEPNDKITFRKPCFWDITPQQGQAKIIHAATAGTMGWDWQHEEDEEDEDEEEDEEDEEEDSGTWAPGPWYAVQEATEDEDSISEGSSETSMNDGANAEAGLEDQDSLFVPDGNLSNTNVQASISPPATTPGNTGPYTTSGTLVIPPPFDHIFPVIRPEIARKFYHAMETSGSHNLEPRSISRPLLIVTKEEIYLIQRPFAPDNAPLILAMRNPLFPPHLPITRIMGAHRQCFTAQIPELGIFIVGSPAGRVGIFRLTQTLCSGEIIYGFRVEHILPYQRQERVVGELGSGSGKQLVGVAVGPVQGMLDERGGDGVEGRRRRWRVMLYFGDHAVETFEVGKWVEGEDGLEGLVV